MHADIRTASDSERVCRAKHACLTSSPPLAALILLAILLPMSGCLSDGGFGPWTGLSTIQFGVPLVAGTTVVEVRDVRDGWVERVSVDSDGRTAMDGIRIEPLLPARSRNLTADDIAYLRGDEPNPIPTTGTTLERAKALSAWVGHRIARIRLRVYGELAGDTAALDPEVPMKQRNPMAIPRNRPRLSREGEAPIASDDGCEILRSVEQGVRTNCLSYAVVYADVSTLAGLTARRVDMAVRYGSPHEGHSVVEVWSDELGKWIVVDPYFQAIWTVDGAPASAIELHRAAVEGRSKAIDFTSTGPGGASLAGSRVNPRLYPRNLFIRVASGSWLTRTNGVPAPVVDTNVLQCDDEAVFSAAPGVADAHVVRRDSLHGRIAFQVIDGRLVVGLARETFEVGRFEARTTAGGTLEVYDETVGHDPADPEIASGPELLTRTKLVDDDRDGTPDGWMVEGALTRCEQAPDGSALLESGEEGSRLVLKPVAKEFASVVGFVRLSVERGSASFSLSGRMVDSRFVVRAGRETVACSPISGWSAAQEGLRLELAPNSRVTVTWISLRTTPKYGDLSGARTP